MTNREKAAKVSELQLSICALRKEKHERHESLTNGEERSISEKIKAFGAEIVSTITEGAKPCFGCEKLPHGMVQFAALKNKPVAYFEIGCLACGGKRAQAFSIDDVVSDWNESKFIEVSKAKPVSE